MADKFIKELIEDEQADLFSRTKEFEQIKESWFKFGKTRYFSFLEKYIKLKTDFIKDLNKKNQNGNVQT